MWTMSEWRVNSQLWFESSEEGKIVTSYGKNFWSRPTFAHRCIALTSGTATYRPTPRHLLEESVNFWRPREADPIASNSEQGGAVCVHIGPVVSLNRHLRINLRSYTEKLTRWFEYICFWFWCVIQHTVRLTRPIKLHTYLMTCSNLFIPNSRIGHSWG